MCPILKRQQWLAGRVAQEAGRRPSPERRRRSAGSRGSQGCPGTRCTRRGSRSVTAAGGVASTSAFRSCRYRRHPVHAGSRFRTRGPAARLRPEGRPQPLFHGASGPELRGVTSVTDWRAVRPLGSLRGGPVGPSASGRRPAPDGAGDRHSLHPPPSSSPGRRSWTGLWTAFGLALEPSLGGLKRVPGNPAGEGCSWHKGYFPMPPSLVWLSAQAPTGKWRGLRGPGEGRRRR